jgi:hypothetical protein
MKKFFSILFGASLLCGCATTTGGSFNAAQQDALITAAASTGTSLALMAKPEYRPAFEAADVTLGLLSQTNQLTVADIQTALTAVNVNGANTPIVALSIQNALTLVNAFGSGASALPATNQLAAVQGVASALQIGIAQGLAVTSTNNP